VTRIKLAMALKAHKPADSGVVAGNVARRCSLFDGFRKSPTAGDEAFRKGWYILIPECWLFSVLADAFSEQLLSRRVPADE